MVFLLPSPTPPPGLAKDHKKYVFFFRTPSLTMQLEFRWFFWNSVLPRADFRNKSDYEGSNAFWNVMIAAMRNYENVSTLRRSNILQRCSKLQCNLFYMTKSTHVSRPPCLICFGHLFLRMSTCGNSRLLEGQGTSD